MEKSYIYIVISHTATRFGRLIRIFGNIDYNHSAIAFDENLNEIYAFARPMYKHIFAAKCVKESYTSYTLNTDYPINIKIFKLEVTKEQLQYVKDTIEHVRNDPEIHYNLFSVLSYPFLKGCHVHKTYTCSEFVTHVLKDLGYPISLPCYQYKPEDLQYLLEDYLIYQGDIRNVLSSECVDENFFKPLTFKQKKEGLKNLYTITKRSFNFTK